MSEFKQTPVAITQADGSLCIMWFVTRGRGDILPVGAKWEIEDDEARGRDGWWVRPCTHELVFQQIIRANRGPDDPENKKPMPERYEILAEDAEIPADRSYRNAWACVDGKIVIDMPRARELHRAKLREARAYRMAELDVQFMRALESGGDTADIAAQKQTLRDVTADPAIDAAETIDQLKAVTLGLL